MTCRLLALGHEVILVDNFSTGRMENLEGVELGASARLLKLDISREGSLDGAFDRRALGFPPGRHALGAALGAGPCRNQQD